MIIYSMTATFGKLEHETLKLQPGLNILEAPNEWGKSTWCAFLIAMLYGIETKERTTQTTLAAKERYAPWSGSPMSGRIDLHWNGRDITIQRRTKGRSIFGEFSAYETDSGLAVEELTAANCGQQLLGVEKSVFVRAGFLRLSDLPVTQDEPLRRRLNALVTTGDESGTADALAQKLKDLKNRCYSNRSNGLLPQAQAQKQALEDKLRELGELQQQIEKIKQRQEELEVHRQGLLNHQMALEYAENQNHYQKIAAAEMAQAEADKKVEQLQTQWGELPAYADIEAHLQRVQALREQRDALQMEAQMLPAAPQAPNCAACFRGISPQEAIRQAEADEKTYRENCQKLRFPWMPVLLLGLLAVAALWIPIVIKLAISVGALMAAGAISVLSLVRIHSRKAKNTALLTKYAPLSPEDWGREAAAYGQAQEAYAEQIENYQADRSNLESRMETWKHAVETLTQGSSLWEYEQHWRTAQARQAELSEALREQRRTAELRQALQTAGRESAPPTMPDTLTYTAQETTRLLSDCVYEQRQLHQKLGHCQGRMETLGQEAALKQQLLEANRRIAQLEDTHGALEIALDTLTKASNELQRRFAPRISKRAQTLFGRLTQGRYDRLTLLEDLSVQAGAKNEDTLHAALWRSEGTVDQLYLALRLAVARELTPEAPLVLDDALVRFDDARLAQAITILKEEAQQKQVILFTCQSREKKL